MIKLAGPVSKYCQQLALIVSLALGPTTLANATPAADPLVFQRQQQGQSVALSYAWQDQHQRPQQLTLNYDKRLLFDSFRDFRGYQKQRANREVKARLARYIREHQWHNVQVKLTPQQRAIRLLPTRANDNSPETQQRLMQLAQVQQEIYNQYLRDNYYSRIHTPAEGSLIKPDHIRIARDSMSIIKPIADSFRQQLGNNSQREYLNSIAYFIQSIPYRSLEADADSRGDGFNPPARLLYENQGDCDSKATLMLALIQELMPSIKAGIVYIPNHAFIAVSVSTRKDDQTIEHNGRKLVLIDPTGPAHLPLGSVSDSTLNAIHSQQYQLDMAAP